MVISNSEISKDNVLDMSKAYLGSFNNFAMNISAMKKQYPVMSQGAHDIEGAVLKINKEVNEIVASKVNAAMEKKESTI